MHMDRTFADTVFRNGRIYTSNAQQPWANCAAVKAGRFVAVCSAEGTPR